MSGAARWRRYGTIRATALDEMDRVSGAAGAR
jgi:hypothetical protein